MKTTLRRIFLISTIVIFSALTLILTTLGGILLFSPKTKFDINKIKYSQTALNLYDNNNCPIEETNKAINFVKINTLPDYVKQSFISIEDKSFYKHSGLNYKRMAKAMLKNISSFKIKEGASTISQQLIKNTHLTSERTFTRKFNEILLTKQLEKQFSKDEILEYYLNIIYFGDNCYGIENASKHYFSKSAKYLSVDESATLAGMIKSPNSYSPIRNPEKTKKRRNLVLREMMEDKKIDLQTYIDLSSKKIDINVSESKDNFQNSYSQACYDEAIQILKMPQKQIAIGEYKIYTYYNKEKQLALKDASLSQNLQHDYSAISMTPNGEIEAYIGKSNLKLIDIKRQPGSAIKPILVYAPALDRNIISPLTQINDEKIDINGYSPSNVSNKFYGYVSVRDSVAKSLNIPAVKTLGYVGVETAKNYAKNCNIDFEEQDNSLSLALGGMTYGTSLKTLTNAYTSLCNDGKFTEAKFISYITDKNNKIIYTNPHNEKKVFRSDSSYLMTDMLKNCVTNGTAKKLGNLDFPIASKTGTVGKVENTDAWNISYTTQNIVGVWIGNVDNKPIGNIVGGGIPTDIAKNYHKKISANKKPYDFIKPSSVYEEKIDLLSLQDEHEIIKANDYIPEKYIIIDTFSKFNQPKEKSTHFISVQPVELDGKVENNYAILGFEAQDYLIYEIYKFINGKQQLISVVTNKKGKIEEKFEINKNQKIQFYVVTKIKNYADNSEVVSDKSNIIELYNNGKNNNEKTNSSKWYI